MIQLVLIDFINKCELRALSMHTLHFRYKY